MNHFLVIDVETANWNQGSICQIGIVECKNDKVIDSWCSYINPKDEFNEFNINIHGITDEMVKDASTFKEIYGKLNLQIADKICCSYGHFDRSSISKACEINDLKELDINWIDVLPIAREYIDEEHVDNYKLSTIANYIGFKFKNHDALEDAKACAEIILEIIRTSDFSAEDWLHSHPKSSNPSRKASAKPTPPDSHFNRMMQKRWFVE